MRRDPQWQILRDMLYKAPGHALTLREIEIEGYIRNVPDAAMQARKHGVNITTEYLHDNPKIASYMLHETTVDYRTGEPKPLVATLEEHEVAVTRDNQGKLLEVDHNPTNRTYQ